MCVELEHDLGFGSRFLERYHSNTESTRPLEYYELAQAVPHDTMLLLYSCTLAR